MSINISNNFHSTNIIQTLNNLQAVIPQLGGIQFKDVNNPRLAVDFSFIQDKVQSILLVPSLSVNDQRILLNRLKELDNSGRKALQESKWYQKILTIFREFITNITSYLFDSGNRNSIDSLESIVRKNELDDSLKKTVQHQGVQESREQSQTVATPTSIHAITPSTVKIDIPKTAVNPNSTTTEPPKISKASDSLEVQIKELNRNYVKNIAEIKKSRVVDYDPEQHISDIIKPHVEFLENISKKTPDALAKNIQTIITVMQHDPNSLAFLIKLSEKSIQEAIYLQLDSPQFRDNDVYADVLASIFIFYNEDNLPQILRNVPTNFANQEFDYMLGAVVRLARRDSVPQTDNVLANRYKNRVRDVLRALFRKCWLLQTNHAHIPDAGDHARTTTVKDSLWNIFDDMIKRWPAQQVTEVFVESYAVYNEYAIMDYQNLIKDDEFCGGVSVEKAFFSKIQYHYKDIIDLFTSVIPSAKQKTLESALNQAIRSSTRTNLFLSIYTFQKQLWKKEGPATELITKDNSEYSFSSAVQCIPPNYLFPNYFLKHFVEDKTLIEGALMHMADKNYSKVL